MMTAGLLTQYAVIGLVVSISAAYVVRRQFPAFVRRMRMMLALPLVRNGRARWLQRIGRSIAPSPRLRGVSCSGCGGCD